MNFVYFLRLQYMLTFEFINNIYLKILHCKSGCQCSLCRRHNLLPVSNICKAVPIFWAANHNVFRYSFQPDWHTDNGIFKRPIIAHMQVLVHRWATGCPVAGFQCCLTRGLNQKFSSVCGTG